MRYTLLDATIFSTKAQNNKLVGNLTDGQELLRLILNRPVLIEKYCINSHSLISMLHSGIDGESMSALCGDFSENGLHTFDISKEEVKSACDYKSRHPGLNSYECFTLSFIRSMNTGAGGIIIDRVVSSNNYIDRDNSDVGCILNLLDVELISIKNEIRNLQMKLP